MIEISRREAVRMALAAQGFTRRRPKAVTRRHLLEVMDTVGIVQIDSVNVLTRSHYLPFLSRLGPYDTGLLDDLRDGRRTRASNSPASALSPGVQGAPDAHASLRRRSAPVELVEYWVHEASLIRPATWPLLGFRMRRAHSDAWGGMRSVAREHPQVVQAVREFVTRHGPLTARATDRLLTGDPGVDGSVVDGSGVDPVTHVLAAAAARTAQSQEWGWNWSLVKNALEHLFWSGELTSAGRTVQFERRYATPAAVLPPDVLRRGPFGAEPVPDEDAFYELMSMAARATGVGSVQCLRDYARLKPDQAGPALTRLLEEGVLLPARVEGWKRPAYVHRDASAPSSVSASALLSPFDSLIWERNRTAALFGFDYRLEIYTPAPKRVYGYYVLPFLHKERLVARVDLKADRAAGVLRAHAVHWEAKAPSSAAEALQERLSELAGFLGLGAVAIGGHRARK